jgi:hypothetical protein
MAQNDRAAIERRQVEPSTREDSPQIANSGRFAVARSQGPMM